MNRVEFMKQLEALLSNVSPAERAEALQYYNDYFNDAGHENEGEVMKALGSPAKVAEMIKSGLNDKASESGEYTETGFQSGDTRSDEMMVREHAYQKQNSNDVGEGNKNQKKQMNSGMILLLIILAVVSFPVWLPVVISLFAILIGIIVGIFGIVVGLGVGGIALIIAAVILLILGVIRIFTGPLSGVILIGTSFLLVGIGILLCILAGVFSFYVIPVLCKGVIHLIGLPFKYKGGKAA